MFQEIENVIFGLNLTDRQGRMVGLRCELVALWDREYPYGATVQSTRDDQDSGLTVYPKWFRTLEEAYTRLAKDFEHARRDRTRRYQKFQPKGLTSEPA